MFLPLQTIVSQLWFRYCVTVEQVTSLGLSHRCPNWTKAYCVCNGQWVKEFNDWLFTYRHLCHVLNTFHSMLSECMYPQDFIFLRTATHDWCLFAASPEMLFFPTHVQPSSIVTYGAGVYCIPRNMHTVHVLFYPYDSRLIYWHYGNRAIEPVPENQTWAIWVMDFVSNWLITIIYPKQAQKNHILHVLRDVQLP